MLEKAVQSAIYEKALKNHYIEILYIDFENTGKCIKLHQDTKLLGGENIFPESDEQMFDDYISKKIMRYASGDAEGIITALGYDYFSVLLVDPEKDHVTIFRQRSLNGKSIADLCAKYHNCWSEFIPNYAKERVSDASYDEFMEKLSLDYIRSAKESYISVYEYVSDDGIVYYQIKVAFVQKQQEEIFKCRNRHSNFGRAWT